MLPFANLSKDPDQDYLADGMVDEDFTGLGRIRWLQVNSSFALNGKSNYLEGAGRALGVAICSTAVSSAQANVYASPPNLSML